MPSIQQFSRSMIEQSLRARNYKFLRDSDGDFVVQFVYDSDADCELTLYFMAAGQKSQIYNILGRANKRIPRNEWGRVVMLCNTWNREKRWPKVYLSIDDSPSANASGEIFLEELLDLEEGIHQELLNKLTYNMVVGTNFFWEWMHKEHGI